MAMVYPRPIWRIEPDKELVNDVEKTPAVTPPHRVAAGWSEEPLPKIRLRRELLLRPLYVLSKSPQFFKEIIRLPFLIPQLWRYRRKKKKK